MTKTEFSKLDKKRKVTLLKDLGKFMANRQHEGFFVSLFYFEEFYVEVWKRVGLEYIEYIEVVNDQNILAKYVDNLNFGDLI